MHISELNYCSVHEATNSYIKYCSRLFVKNCHFNMKSILSSNGAFFAYGARKNRNLIINFCWDHYRL